MEYAARPRDTKKIINTILLDLILVGMKQSWNVIFKKKALQRLSPKCHQSLVSDSRNFFRVLKVPQTISVMIDWHVSSWATINSCRKKENSLIRGSGLFVLWFDFCGSRCRRNATERGIFNNLPRQTVWRHMLLKPGHIHLFQRFLWTPTVSLKMESRATVQVNVCLIQIWQVVV